MLLQSQCDFEEPDAVENIGLTFSLLVLLIVEVVTDVVVVRNDF